MISEKILLKQAWLVSARSDVQWLLLEVRHCAKALGDPPDPLEIALLRNACDCAFSLWRAVFLIPDEKDRTKLAQHIDLFLRNVIDDNTILYGQDKSANYYSSYYYLRNAALRIERCSKYLSHPSSKALVKLMPKSELHQFQTANNTLSSRLEAFEDATNETSYTDTFEATLTASIALTALILKHLKIAPVQGVRSSRFGK
jgi:hypothetical protein